MLGAGGRDAAGFAGRPANGACASGVEAAAVAVLNPTAVSSTNLSTVVRVTTGAVRRPVGYSTGAKAVHTSRCTDVEELGLGRGGAGDGVTDGVLDGVLHLRGDVLHGGGGHRDDGALHRNGEHLVHLHRDVLDSALRDACHRLLDNRVLAEDAEVGLGNDLELHPGHLAKHHRELLVRLHEDDDAALEAEAGTEVEAG